MDWSKGYSASFHMTIVDPHTWRDVEQVEIIDASITRDNSLLRESADVSCRSKGMLDEKWIRLWLVARQEEDHERVALFTGITTCPKNKINGTITEIPLECYSILKPADDVLLPRGYYVPVNISGAKAVKNLLNVTHAPVEITGESPKLLQAIIAEDGETNLSMADKILNAIDWRIRISGNGSITICEKAYASSAVIGTNYDIVEPQVDLEQDWYSCPNVFRAVADGLSAVARDDDPNSLLSTVSRGREIWQEEIDCDMNDGETIAEYAARKLKELQTYGIEASYDRRFVPNIYPGDIITLNYPSIDALSMKDYTVNSQSLNLGLGIRMSETVSR